MVSFFLKNLPEGTDGAHIQRPKSDLDRQLRELQQRELIYQKQLREMEQHEKNYRGQLREMEQREENYQWLLREIEQREENYISRTVKGDGAT